MVIARQSLSRNEILNQIWETVPVGADEPTDQSILAKLKISTHDLIQAGDLERLKVNPFQEVCDRSISFYRSEIAAIVKDKVVLVTGGVGFVGSHLIARLCQLGVKRIVSVDLIAAGDDNFDNIDISHIYYQTDVRDRAALAEVFNLEQPDLVFHLAAQRLPGLAETQVYQTITTNILGSNNIIQLCEQYHVDACIFSSTGKASRYYTPDIYAGSKKIAEWLFSDRLAQKKCQYGIVRFTHVVENSPISLELDHRVEQGLVSLHAPDRFTYAQNVTESVSLLLNALTMLEHDNVKLFAVTNLGWPINTLDIALHKIVKAGGNIPIYFKGVPKGYETSMFMGQLDLSGERDILPMLNVLEVGLSRMVPTKDMVVTNLHPFSSPLLAECLDRIQQAGSDLELRSVLNHAIKEMVIASFKQAHPTKLLDILGWGIDPQYLAKPDVDVDYYHEFAELILAGLDRKFDPIDPARVSAQTLTAIDYLKSVPSMAKLAQAVATQLTKSPIAPIKVIQNIHFPISARSFIAPIVDYLNQAGIAAELWVEHQPKHLDVLNQLTVPKQIIASDLVKNPIEVCRRIWEYYHRLKVAQPSILHTHQSRAAVIPLIAGYLAQVPVRIYHNHGLPYLGYKGAMRWCLMLLERINISLATHVLLVSQSNLEAARQDGLLAPNQGQAIASGSIAGIDLNEYEIEQFDATHRNLARDKFGIDRDSFVLSYVGRPFKRKGFHRLLAAWQASGLAAQGGVLSIAGCTQAQCQAAYGDNLAGVQALGYINNLQEFYAACDATVLPSYHEGFGYAILETAAAGKPSIGSNIPGISCAIDHNLTGLLVPADDDLALIRAIQTLASDVELRNRLGAAARQRVEAEFSREVVFGHLFKYYQQILNQVPESAITTSKTLSQSPTEDVYIHISHQS